MPFVEGESLRARTARDARLPAGEVVSILSDVADALAYAHRRGVGHRDIKPDNVLVSGGHALVTDFGVSKALGQSGPRSPLTSAGMAIGTPAYMAPEQAAGDPGVDHRADIYAVGGILYHFVTGKRPFDDEDPAATLTAVLTEEPRRPCAIDPALPAALEMVVQRAMAKDPSQRFGTMAEFDEALAAGLQQRLEFLGEK